MTDNIKIVDPWDAESGWLNEDRPNEVSGSFLNRFAPEVWSVAKFGRDYEKCFFSKEAVSFFVNLLFDPPAVDIGIKFSPFCIPEDAITADHCEDLLSSIYNLSDRRSFYIETRIQDNDVSHPWYNLSIDDSYLARFIPFVMVSDADCLFHAPHLYQALDHLFDLQGVAPFFAEPRGPSAKFFHLA